MRTTRLTLRTTVAVAGMAALGFGLAGTAVAAPAEAPRTAPARTAPAPIAPAQAAPDASPLLQSGSPLATLAGVAQERAIPGLLGFGAPRVNTGSLSAGTPLTPQLTTPAMTGR